MARNRGLGIGKDSLFKNTVKPNSEKKKSVDKVIGTSVKQWEKYTSMLLVEHRKAINEIAFYKDKEKRQVLSEMIQFYLDKHQ